MLRWRSVNFGASRMVNWILRLTPCASQVKFHTATAASLMYRGLRTMALSAAYWYIASFSVPNRASVNLGLDCSTSSRLLHGTCGTGGRASRRSANAVGAQQPRDPDIRPTSEPRLGTITGCAVAAPLPAPRSEVCLPYCAIRPVQSPIASCQSPLRLRRLPLLHRLLDHLLRHVRRHLFVVRELHREVPAPLRQRPHVR